MDRNLCARGKVHPFRRLAPQVSSSPAHSVSARAPSTLPLLQAPALCPSQAGGHGSHRLSAPQHLAQTLTRYGGADERRAPWLEAPGSCPQRGTGHNGNALLGALRGFPPGEGTAVPTGADPRQKMREAPPRVGSQRRDACGVQRRLRHLAPRTAATLRVGGSSASRGVREEGPAVAHQRV